VAEILNYAIDEWTKRGTRNDEMTAYLFHQVSDAWEDLEWEKKQSSFKQAKFNSCSREWGTRFDLVAYCYKE
jgi:hypothetical protein